MNRLLLPVLALLAASPAAAQPPSGEANVRADLLTDAPGVRPGTPITVALRLRMRPGWHVYWRNPGDSGLPPTIAWSLPAGFVAGPPRWPAPERIPVPPMMNFGFAETLTLLSEVTPPAGAAGATPVRIGGHVDYLACKVECVPGSAEVALDVPSDGPADAEGAAVVAQAREALAVPAPWPAGLSRAGDGLSLDIAMPEGEARAVSEAAFFPDADNVIDHASPQPLRADGSGLHVSLIRATPGDPIPPTLSGVLVLDGTGPSGRRAFDLTAGQAPGATDRDSEIAPPKATPAAMPAKPEGRPVFLAALGLALLGGLCLNLMPCVFPVLSIKVLGLLRQAGDDRRRIRLHGLSYAAGVLASFLALAGTLMAIRGAGGAAGWGFQLQSPVAVAGLAYLLLATALSLSGVFYVGARVAGIGDGLTRRSGLQGSFFTGVLATIVATPCTAPFMGTAIGFALTAPAAEWLAVFAGLGIGLAAPFLLLTLRPGLVRVLPRPGAWMETLKQALAFPVYATAAWLVWVLAQQVSPDGLLTALAGLVMVGFSAWAWGKAGGSRPWPARATAAAGLAAAIVLAAGLRQGPPAGAPPARGSEPFSQARLDALTAAGRPVLVDMTAAWCITCKVNERTALSDAGVRGSLAERGVTTLVGDWTNGDPEITRLLEARGREGVPLYLLYGASPQPIVLPQILTPSIVLDALSRLPSRAAAREAEVSAGG